MGIATVEGLGTCMIGWFDKKTVSSVLEFPSDRRPLLIIAFGSLKIAEFPKKIKLVSQIASKNRYLDPI